MSQPRPPQELDPRVWTETYPIHIYEIDAQLRVTIQSVWNFLLDAAGHNAHALGFSVPQLLEKHLTWFLSRLLIKMEAYPKWKENLTIQTWPSGVDKLFALRDFRLVRGEQKIGSATSAWLLIDTNTRRPVRPNSLFEGKGLIHEERVLQARLDKLPSLEAEDQEKKFRVRYSDMDLNRHVTAERYIDWLLEAVPLELQEQCSLGEIEINFLAEAGYGERVLSMAQPMSSQPLEYRHSMRRKKDSTELTRARTLWKNR